MLKTVVIYGQNHKGSTYHIAHSLAEKIGGDITEYFLPRDFGEFCLGCNTCFFKTADHCPHYAKLQPIIKSLDESDVIILASPVYVYHVAGPMKAFLDHFGNRWMVHCPEESMFKKQGVCICTAAGGGMKSTLKDMVDSLSFWGVARIRKYGKAVMAVNWEGVSDKKKALIDKDMTFLANKIIKNSKNVRASLKTKLLFYCMIFVQRISKNPKDTKYWNDKGWLKDKRPWK